MKPITTLLVVLGATLLFGGGTVLAGTSGAKSAESKPVAANSNASKPSSRKSDAAKKPLRLEEFSVSEHVSGPQVDLAKATNKLTVLYFWGYRCPPCMQTLPKLVKFDHDYRSKGLVIVGIHAASGGMEDIRATCVKHGVEFSVYRQYKVPGRYRMIGLPRVLMFDEAGNVVFDGNYTEISKEIESRFKN